MEETRAGSSKNSSVTAAAKHDPLYRIRNALRAGADRLTARQIERIEAQPTMEVVKRMQQEPVNKSGD